MKKETQETHVTFEWNGTTFYVYQNDTVLTFVKTFAEVLLYLKAFHLLHPTWVFTISSRGEHPYVHTT